MDYFEKHNQGKLTTKNAVYSYDLFAVIKDDGTNQLLFDPLYGIKSEILNYIVDNSFIYRDFDKDLKLLALSTCQGSGTDRLLVIGTLTRIGEEDVLDE